MEDTVDVLLEARHIRKSFDTGQGTLTGCCVTSICRLLLSERVAVVGRIRIGENNPDAYSRHVGSSPVTGSVFFNGVDLFSLSAAQLDAFRNATLGFVFPVSYSCYRNLRHWKMS